MFVCYASCLFGIHDSFFFFFLMIRRPPRSTLTDTLFPYTTLFRSICSSCREVVDRNIDENGGFATRCKSAAVQIAVEKILSAQANPDLPFHDLLSIRTHVHLPSPKVVDRRKAQRCDRPDQVEAAGTFSRFMSPLSHAGRVKGHTRSKG